MVTYRDEGDTIDIMLPYEAEEILNAITVIKAKLSEFRANPESLDLEDLEADEEFQEAVEIAQTDDDIFLSSHLNEIASNSGRTTSDILDDIFLELDSAENSLNTIIHDDPDILDSESDLTDLD